MEQGIQLFTSHLRIGYKDRGAEKILFEDLNLNLPSGSLVCFMGPNGIGKSSLIRTLAGIQKPLQGEIKVNHPSAKKEELISVVLTDKINSVNMTVYDLVAFGRYPYLDWTVNLKLEDEEKIYRAIRLAHVEHLQDFPIHELSDGQLQMVMIARALAQDTPIILLDEPTAHLDLNNRVEIMKLLKKLSRSTNKSILVATHELDLALQTADLIWLTGKNKNILTGLPEDLVLEGAFDRIFEFKGFDLKTGKVQHDPHRGVEVSVTGEGHELLWTKNALERNGFALTEHRAQTHVSIVKNKDITHWLLYTVKGEQQINSIGELIKCIVQTIAERVE